MQRRIRLSLAMTLLLPAGCHEAANPDASAPVAALGQAFAAETTGTVQGRVTWQGDLPQAAPFQVHAFHDYANTHRLRGEHPNPHAPNVDPETRGVGQVVLVLRHVNPELSKPWRHPPVQVHID